MTALGGITMRKNIRWIPPFIYAFIYELILGVPGVILSVVAFIIGLQSKDAFILIFYGAFFCISCSLVVLAVYNIQWIEIRDQSFVVHNVFGRVKEQKIEQTKRAFFMDAVVFQLKSLRQTAPCIVLSTKKSLKIRDVEQAFNRKRYSYIVIPYRAENVKMIKDAYFDVMNTELEIK
jgi:hypothetical protein